MSAPTPIPSVAAPAVPSAALGVLLALGAVALFAPIFAAARLAEVHAGVAAPMIAIVWLRYLSGFATVAVATAVTGTRPADLRSATPGLHLLRACLGAAGLGCILQAAVLLPLADATAIGLVKGLLVVAFAALILGERVTRAHWGAALLCAAGAGVVIVGLPLEAGSIGSDRVGLEGALYALAGAVFIALETLTIKVLARREGALGVLAHVNGVAAVLWFGPTLWAVSAAGLGAGDLAVFLLMGPLAILGQFLNVRALRLADAAVIGPVGYASIVFAALLGWAAFGETPGPATWAGATLILFGGVWLARLRGPA
ncbi:MAG: DMT family transporter [Paracoccaceae bacterium]